MATQNHIQDFRWKTSRNWASRKNESLDAGTPPCIAEIFAAQLLNRNNGKPIAPLHGVVTFGREWQFIRLDGNVAVRDSDVYQNADLPKIIGILQYIIDLV